VRKHDGRELLGGKALLKGAEEVFCLVFVLQDFLQESIVLGDALLQPLQGLDLAVERVLEAGPLDSDVLGERVDSVAMHHVCNYLAEHLVVALSFQGGVLKVLGLMSPIVLGIIAFQPFH